jgi:hypothetical protein
MLHVAAVFIRQKGAAALGDQSGPANPSIFPLKRIDVKGDADGLYGG